MGCFNYSNFITFITSSISRSYYNVINRSKFKYYVLWRRRRSYSLSTFILILWTSWSLYFNFTRIWINFSHCSLGKRKKRGTFGVLGIVYTILAIGILGFVVWAHHIFTVGINADTRTYFITATIIIPVQTGIKVFRWLGTFHEVKI